ncbi:MAG: adenine deaminase, partial [Lachnospiraceae bacterium]|nr:adenine deaminase [Lachnospiraceae bacterium]
MHSDKLKKVIDTAMGRRRADIVLKGGNIIDVYSGKVIQGDVAICGDTIAGIGQYEGEEEIDVSGKYLSPGLIDSHIHIESSYLTPEEFARIIVPCGTTTVISDPHEIVNVCGTEGLRYMIKASKNAALKVKFMVPSCVPATPFENAGAVVTSKDIERIFEEEDVLGLGEFMNAVGVINNDDECINKIVTAINDGRVIDGHSPGITGNQLNAYASAHIENDHECMSVEEMEERIMRGMYVIMREGSACHDLKTLIKGLTPENSRRCLLCSD